MVSPFFLHLRLRLPGCSSDLPFGIDIVNLLSLPAKFYAKHDVLASMFPVIQALLWVYQGSFSMYQRLHPAPWPYMIMPMWHFSSVLLTLKCSLNHHESSRYIYANMHGLLRLNTTWFLYGQSRDLVWNSESPTSLRSKPSTDQTRFPVIDHRSSPASAAMHDCLSIPETVSVIFDNLYETKQMRIFASLARTCRAFTGQFQFRISVHSGWNPLAEPALDILWRDQPTLVPLIKCFPHDILGTSVRGDVVRDLNQTW